MAVTIMDVARESGVHRSTVSRALNNQPDVSPAVRAKVLEVARKLNYRPSAAARVMGGCLNETIGLVTEIESGIGPYGPALIEGISMSLSERGVRLATNVIHWGGTTDDVRRLPLFKTDAIDGVILDVHKSEGNIEAVVREYGVPFVFVNPARGKDLNAVVPDDVSVARQATVYLAERGHKAIGYVPCFKTEHISQANRVKGYMEAMESSGLKPLPVFTVPVVEKREQGLSGIFLPGMEAKKELVAYLRQYSCRGFVVYSAPEANWLYSVLLTLGYRIPEDISIISCDYDPILSYMETPVTSFFLDRIQMGRTAVEMLQKRIESKGEEEPAIMVEGVLKEGLSVAERPGTA
ncbi:MAG: LacI family DNA-binding transcriptional regulator [Verrucomicrobiota bacterium]